VYCRLLVAEACITSLWWPVEQCSSSCCKATQLSNCVAAKLPRLAAESAHACGSLPCIYRINHARALLYRLFSRWQALGFVLVVLHCLGSIVVQWTPCRLLTGSTTMDLHVMRSMPKYCDSTIPFIELLVTRNAWRLMVPVHDHTRASQ
jgi:hypothetical protein